MKTQTLAPLFGAVLVLACSALVAQDNNQTVDFQNDIRPILESNCVSCHGVEEPEGGYRIDIRDEALEYVEAGDAEGSEFYEYLITDDEDALMPPRDDGGPLDDSDISLIKTWINEGASWPEGVVLKDPDAENSMEGGDEDQDPQAADQDNLKIFRAIGSLHPAAVHLPVGLLLAAGLFSFLSLRGNFVMSDCAYYCLWLGALGAIVASLTGWWFTLSEFPKEVVNEVGDLVNQKHDLFWHRTSALIATVFALLLAMFASSARNRDPDDGMGWKLGAIILAIGIGFVGHKGGELTWKESHYKELNEVWTDYTSELFDAAGAGAVDAPVNNDADDETDAEEAGGSGETTGDGLEL